MWLQLAIKALVSGALIAAASELARRNPAWGGLVASLPLTTLLALLWLWRDGPDAARAGNFVTGTAWYVIAALPALFLLGLLLRRGVGLAPSLAAGIGAAWLGYFVLGWAGKRWGLPV